MTLEEIAKLSLEAAMAETRFMYEASGRDVERYCKLRLAVYRTYLDSCDDPEFAGYLAKAHGLFKEAVARQQAAGMTVKMMDEPEMVSAMKRMQDHIEQGDT